MPTYEYRCRSCGTDLEVVQSFDDEPLTTCAECGGPLRKVFGSVGISFKGSGFYKNDSRSGAKSRSGGSSASGSDSSGSSGDASSSGSSTTSTDSGGSPSGSGAASPATGSGTGAAAASGSGS